MNNKINLSATITYDLDIEVLKLMDRIVKENNIEDLPDNISEEEQEIISAYTGKLFDEVWNKIILTELGMQLYRQNKEIIENLLTIKQGL